jgi:hypothetical protein
MIRSYAWPCAMHAFRINVGDDDDASSRCVQASDIVGEGGSKPERWTQLDTHYTFHEISNDIPFPCDTDGLDVTHKTCAHHLASRRANIKPTQS